MRSTRTNSDRRIRYRRITPAISTSDRLAAMTTAASTEEGRSARSAGAKTSIRTMSPAPTSPASWVRTPDDIATEVRDALALTANPDSAADPKFAAPRATNSAFAFDRSPRRAARVRDSTDVSAIETSAIATAPANSVSMSAIGIEGIDGRGRPGGKGPTTGTSATTARPATADTIVPTTTATRIAGNLGTTRPAATMNASAATPIARATALVRPARNPSANPTASSMRPSASTRSRTALAAGRQ